MGRQGREGIREGSAAGISSWEGSRRLCSRESGISKRSWVRTKQRLWSYLLRSVVYGVAQSRTQLKRLTSSSSSLRSINGAESENVSRSVVSDFETSWSVCRISQARILEWVAIPYSRRSSWPRDQIQDSCIAGRFFTVWAITHVSKANLYQKTQSISSADKREVLASCFKSQSWCHLFQGSWKTRKGACELRNLYSCTKVLGGALWAKGMPLCKIMPSFQSWFSQRTKKQT